jgi:hypothetical protein
MSIGPQLSSVHSSLTEITKRVVDLAESQSGASRDDVASALFEVERSLNTANRRLERLLNHLG